MQDITYVEDFVKLKLPDIIRRKNHEIDERFSCFFGLHTADPKEFDFKLGEIRLIEELIKFVKTKVDEQNNDSQPKSLKLFNDLKCAPASGKHSWKRQLSATPLGMFFDDQKKFDVLTPDQKGVNISHTDVDHLTNTLFDRAAVMLNEHKNSMKKDIFSKNCVTVNIDTDNKVKGSIYCNYCDKTDSIRKVKVYYQTINGSGYWILSNLKKHLSKTHVSREIKSKQNNQNSTAEQAKSENNFSLISLKIEPVRANDIPAEKLKDYESQLYKQIYLQTIQMVNAAHTNKDQINNCRIQFNLAEATQPDVIGISKTEADGDCLYSALAHQLYGNQLNSREHKRQTRSLRDATVEHIGQHLSDYIHILKGRIYEMKDSNQGIKFQNDISTACLTFLSKYLSTNTWAGQETIKAISEIHGVNIVVINQDGSCNLPNHFNTKYERSLLVYYRDYNQTAQARSSSKNHYDSVVEIDSILIAKFVEDLMAMEQNYLQFIDNIEESNIICID